MTKIVRSLRNGQITIPSDFRQKLGIDTDSLLALSIESGELHIKPIKATQTVAGSPWLKDLYKAFAPVRKDASHHTEQEINTAIDKAVKKVRSKKHGKGSI